MKYSVRFDSPENKYIRVRVSWNCKRADVFIGLKYSADWDVETMRFRKDKKKNAVINGVEREIDRLFLKADVFGKMPTRKEVIDAIKVEIGIKADTGGINEDFFACFDNFISTEGAKNGWTDGTIKKVTTVKNHLMNFSPKVEWNDLTPEYAQELIIYLLNKCKLRNTYIDKVLAIVRWFIRWAIANGHTTNDALLKYRPKLKGTTDATKQIVYLEWSELMALYEFDFGNCANYAQIRDVFCFCAFTGLRYSDVANLKWSSVTDTEIRVITKKTDDAIVIELNKWSKAILDRYKDSKFPRGLCLPVMSNQAYNRELKSVCKKVGIDKPVCVTYYKDKDRIEEIVPKCNLITTHTARRTFVVNALALGIDPLTIIKWTGHSSINTMKPYIAITDKLKKSSMALFDRLDKDSVD